jgi:hypothetical protein
VKHAVRHLGQIIFALTLVAQAMPAAAQIWYCRSETDSNDNFSRMDVGFQIDGTPTRSASWMLSRIGIYMDSVVNIKDFGGLFEPSDNLSFFVSVKKPITKGYAIFTAANQKPVRIPNFWYQEPTLNLGLQAATSGDKIRLLKQQDWTVTIYRTNGKPVETLPFRAPLNWNEMLTLYAQHVADLREQAKDVKKTCEPMPSEDEEAQRGRSQ